MLTHTNQLWDALPHQGQQLPKAFFDVRRIDDVEHRCPPWTALSWW